MGSTPWPQMKSRLGGWTPSHNLLNFAYCSQTISLVLPPNENEGGLIPPFAKLLWCVCSVFRLLLLVNNEMGFWCGGGYRGCFMCTLRAVHMFCYQHLFLRPYFLHPFLVAVELPCGRLWDDSCSAVDGPCIMTICALRVGRTGRWMPRVLFYWLIYCSRPWRWLEARSKLTS